TRSRAASRSIPRFTSSPTRRASPTGARFPSTYSVAKSASSSSPSRLHETTAAEAASSSKPLRTSRAWSCASVRRRCASMRSAVTLADPATPRLVFARRGADRLRDAVRRVGSLERFANLRFDRLGDVGVLLEERLRVLAALADPLLAVRVPRARLPDDVAVERDVDDRAHLRDPLAVGDVELGLAERRRDLVLDDLHAGARADDLLADLDLLELADVEANGGVELQRAAARRRLGVAEHDADFLAQLVDEDHHALRARDRGGQLAQRLRHQAGLQPDVRVAHVAFELGFRDERGDGVDHDDVDGVRAHEHLGDVEGLLAGVRLRDEELIEVDPEPLRVGRVERVLDVDERRRPAGLLRLGDDVQRERRLTGRLRPVDLDDAPARQTADAEGEIEGDRSGRDDVERHLVGELAHFHDRAFAELTLDLRERVRKGYLFFVGHGAPCGVMRSVLSRRYRACVPTAWQPARTA